MKRRRVLGWACAHCAAWPGLAAAADEALPGRFTRPDIASDEGGLWALMDREEARLKRSPFTMREPGLREYLSAVACKLGGEHCPDIRVYPVRTPWFNASMAPNGMMQVWSGLLLRVDNEAQLAAVLGHEIAHYLRRHSIERLRDAKSRSAFGQILGVALGGVGALAQLALLAGQSAYSRDHEREADRIGLQLMQGAGYARREAAIVWANMRAEASAGAGGDPSTKSVLFASHPSSVEREQTLARLAAEDGDGFLGADEFRQRLDPLLFGLLDDELRRGQYEETLVLLDRLRTQRPQSALPLYFRAETRRLRDKPEDADAALADLAAAAALPDVPAQAHRSAGLLHRARAEPAAAHAAFERYLAAAPDAPDAGIVRSYIAELQ
ncbi:MAG TPA: M48 family metalloprotease [Methylibium sp.]|nr:M48 family metalloprotease [Methylibium sp.]